MAQTIYLLRDKIQSQMTYCKGGPGEIPLKDVLANVDFKEKSVLSGCGSKGKMSRCLTVLGEK